MGWPSRGSRPTTAQGPAQRGASASPPARSSLPRTRHATRRGRRAFAPQRAPVYGGPRGARAQFPAGVSINPFQRAVRSRTPARRGGRLADLRARLPGTRDPDREGREPHARTCGRRVGGPLSRARAVDAARGPSLSRLRSAELEEARPRCAGDGSAVVSGVVRGLARVSPAAPRPISRRGATDLARSHRLVASRPRQSRRGTRTYAAWSSPRPSRGQTRRPTRTVSS